METTKTTSKVKFAEVPQRTEEITKMVLNAAFKVHTALGPGLLESVYETCLAYELRTAGLQVEVSNYIPVGI